MYKEGWMESKVSKGRVALQTNGQTCLRWRYFVTFTSERIRKVERQQISYASIITQTSQVLMPIPEIAPK